MSEKTKERKYWLYATGEKAKYWDEFYKQGIMGIEWQPGNLNDYNSEDAVGNSLHQEQGGEETKKIDNTTNYEYGMLYR